MSVKQKTTKVTKSLGFL